MFSHTILGTRDLPASIAFYDALLTPLGINRVPVLAQNESVLACWKDASSPTPMFYVCVPLNEEPATIGNGSMLAFLARSSDEVDAAWTAGINAKGSDEGAPGPRPHYGDGYYGAYLRDPDGNKIHVTYRGDLFD